MNKIKVLCFGYIGANNTGSEAKLLTTLDTIKRLMDGRIEELAVLTLDDMDSSREVQIGFHSI